MKKLLYIFSILFLTICLVGCAQSEKASASDYELARAKEKIEVNHKDYTDPGYKAFLEKLDTFSSKITASLYKDYDKDENISVSPISIYMALALTVECSNGQTREEILNALGMTYEEVNKYTKVLYALCNKEFKRQSDNGKEKVVALDMMVNAIWANDNFELIDTGVNKLANDYHCNLFRAPFYSENEKANQAVRDFVKKNTKGLIDQNFKLTKETVIALINTFYLKEVWNTDGDDLVFTKDNYDFVNYKNEKEITKLLQGYYNAGKINEEEKYNNFFTSTENGFKVKFILPKAGYTIDEVFTAENIKHVNNVKYVYESDELQESYYTRCLFPEFEASYDKDIKGVIKDDFGINLLFEPDICDFTNITEENVFCASITHVTKLNVNKTGIEGAAVTIVAMEGESAGGSMYTPVYNDFIIDKSFGYVITDQFGVTLFAGVVKDI